MSSFQAQWLLIAVVVARSSAFLFSKHLLDSIGSFEILAIRFFFAFLLLAAIFHKRLRAATKKTLLHGAIMGLLFFTVMALEMQALKYCDISTAAFLINLAVVFVPFINALVERKKPSLLELICAGFALAGVFFLTLSGGGFRLGFGEFLCLLEALCYACAIVATGRFAHHDDGLTLGLIQIGTMGILSIGAALAFEPFIIPAQSDQWASFALLIVLCTGFGFAFQPVAQRLLTAERTAMLTALSPVASALLGVFFRGEVVTSTMVVGALLILTGLMIPSLKATMTKPLSKTVSFIEK